MEEFLDPARLLLAALGFTALQPIARRADTGDAGPSGPLAEVELHFVVVKSKTDAHGVSTDEGFVVLTGSIGAAKVRPSLSKGWKTQRQELIDDGAIVIEGDYIRFTRDVLFSSPSAAAAITAGVRKNGRAAWKNSTGQSLKALEDALLEASEVEDV